MRLVSPLLQVVEKLRQRRFSFALKNVIGVRKFFDSAGDVWSTEYDQLSSAPCSASLPREAISSEPASR